MGSIFLLIFSETLFFCPVGSEETPQNGEPTMTDLQKEQIEELRRQGCGYSKISTTLSISKNTVKSYCRRNELRTVTTKEAQRCKHCGEVMTIADGDKPRIFCSDKCRVLWWKAHNNKVYPKPTYHLVCRHCGAEFESVGNLRRKYCSHECYIAERFGKERDCDE